jgi:GST-like protein
MAKRSRSKRRKPARAKSARKPARRVAAAAAAVAKPGRQTKPIVLYYWPTPNGWKISVMLEECGLPYEIKPVNIGKGAQFEAAFEAVSPNNRIPAILDPHGPDGDPISVFESGAILEYLGRKTGKVYPREPRKLVQVQEWTYWQVANLGPLAGQAHHFRLYAPEKIPYAIERYEIQVRRLYATMDKRLAAREYLCGEYSIADIASWAWARRWERQGQHIEEFPNVKRWLDAIEARPAVRRALAIRVEEASTVNMQDPTARHFLFAHVGR